MDLGISSELTWTSNASLGAVGGPDDTIVNLRPRMRLHREGARLRLSGTAELGGVAYVDRSQPNRVEPTADLSARLEAIERLFFVEAGYRATQTSENAFGVRADANTTNNRLTTSQWRLSPVIEGAAGSDLRYSLRSDNTWTREIGGSGAAGVAGAGGYFARHSASIGRDPQPFGWRIEAERSSTRYDDPLEQSLNSELARVVLSYAVGPEWSLGLRGGSERNNIATGDDRQHTIYGFETRWQPSPRTSLSAFHESRAFASAWNVAFNHRQPQLAWTVGLARGLDTSPQSLFDLPATNNVAGLLDAMFTTRHPDPVERARLVQDFIARQGLPGATPGPISLFAPRFSLVTSRRVSVSAIGVRNTLTLTGFSVRTEDALDSGPLAGGTSQTNNIQRGASLVLSHRLSALAALSGTLDWSHTRGLGTGDLDETTQEGVSVQVSLQAGPKTNAFFGGRYRKLDSTVTTDGKEGSVFVGLDHRF